MGVGSGYFINVSEQEIQCWLQKRPDVWNAYAGGGNTDRAAEGLRSSYNDWWQWACGNYNAGGGWYDSDIPGADQSEWLASVRKGCTASTWFATASDATIEALWRSRDFDGLYRGQGWFNDSISRGRQVTRGVMRMCLNDWWYRTRPAEYSQYGGNPQAWASALTGQGGGTPATPGAGTPGQLINIPGLPGVQLPGSIDQVVDWAKKNPTQAIIAGVVALFILRR